MEEADRILINSLISVGLEVSDENMSLEDFSPNILINATSLCLEYIFESKNQQQSFPKSCPDLMASRYKVGQTLSEAIKSVGYKDEIGYQSFLYPNVKDTRKIISFLIENLPKETGPSVVEGLDEASKIKSIIKNSFAENWKSPWLPYYCQDDKFSNCNVPNKCLLIPFSSDKKQLKVLTEWFDSFPNITSQVDDFSQLLVLARNYELKSGVLDKINTQHLSKRIKQINAEYYEKESKDALTQSFIQKPEARKRSKFMNKNEVKTEQIKEELNKKDAVEEAEIEFNDLQSSYETSVADYNLLLDKLDKLNDKYESLLQSEQELNHELDATRQECQVKDKLSIVLMHGESSVDKLQGAISKRENQIGSMETQWNEHKADLLKRIEEVRSKQMHKFMRTREIERQLDDIKQDMTTCRQDYQTKDSEIRVLDEKVKQILKASTAVKQNRNDFTKRILELSENKKKQNVEIKKILADIFALQKEINSLRGKLERSFKETSDCIYEWSKKDEMSKKMHKVLLGIHENCSNLVEIIEEKGRLMREIRDLETTIENENRENIETNLDKIQHDYDEAQKNCSNLKKAIKDFKSKQAH